MHGARRMRQLGQSIHAAHAAKPIDSQCTDGGTAHGFYECAITLSDTRKVDCVVYAWEKQGGLSCDWDHVSGVDKEPAR